MRGEVLSLTRNLKVSGENVESWGCQILTADVTEDDGTKRFGKTYMDSVEVYDCSQRDTDRAAIRFDGAVTFPQEVKNCAIHNGWCHGMNLKSSE